MAPIRIRTLFTLLILSASLAALPAAAQIPLCPAPAPHPPVWAHISPPQPCNGDPVRLVFEACGPCVDLVGAGIGREGILVHATVDDRDCVLDICKLDSLGVALGTFAAGHHFLRWKVVTDHTFHISSGGSFTCTYVHEDSLRFDVSPSCGTPADSLPYVQHVWIGRNGPCDPCPPVVCPDDSIRVFIHGEFPDDCIGLERVELIEQPFGSPFPAPPIVRLVYARNDCLDRPCALTPYPWRALVTLPPLPAIANAAYGLRVEALLRNIHCQPPADSSVIGRAKFAFSVSERCSVGSEPCFLAGFALRPRDPRYLCDRFVGPERPAKVEYRIGSTVDLYGLQGEFLLNSPALQVTDIVAIGPAGSMRLQWQPTPQGARFVLFSDGDAHIPAAPPLEESTRVPILSIQVGLSDAAVIPPARFVMRADGLLGSDRQGRGVLGCPIMFLIEPWDQYVIFCTERGCDFNADGSTDVRDLVRMVRCVRDVADCPVPMPIADCNGDGGFSLGDVYCCALAILNGGSPDSIPERPDPSLRVGFDAPIRDGAQRVVRVRVIGSENALGGAHLVLDYPGGRYDLVNVTFPGDEDWLQLYEDADGSVSIGLVSLGGHVTRTVHLEADVRLALKPGQSDGGAVSLARAEFADPQGVGLLASLGSPSVELGGTGDLALSPGRPNPFGGQVAFGVTLTRAGDLDVIIHDLSGRRVATLHRGPAAAGSHPFTWDGRSADGTAAPNGIYFYRATGLGIVQSRKVVLLREP